MLQEQQNSVTETNLAIHKMREILRDSPLLDFKENLVSARLHRAEPPISVQAWSWKPTRLVKPTIRVFYG